MLDAKVLKELQDYVDNYSGGILFSSICFEDAFRPCTEPSDLEDFIKISRQPTFRQVLFGYIDQKGISDADIYKRAGIDRRHFSKIRSNPGYRPGKNTVIALALALALDRDETDRLLSAAGHALYGSETFDLVIQFCLEKGIYDLDEVSQALVYFSLQPLTGVE